VARMSERVNCFSYVDLEQRVPAKHPLRLVRGVVGEKKKPRGFFGAGAASGF